MGALRSLRRAARRVYRLVMGLRLVQSAHPAPTDCDTRTTAIYKVHRCQTRLNDSAVKNPA